MLYQGKVNEVLKGMISKIPVEFYNNNAVQVAKALIGKRLVYKHHQGIITETEAYRGNDDAASHAYRGLTKRNEAMFGAPGCAYVYMIYGMYYCLNIVTEAAGQGSAVLIRGLRLPQIHLDGPGKICRHLGITHRDNAVSLLNNDDFYLADGGGGLDVENIIATPRIGITKATDKLWRFLAVMPAAK